VVLEAVTPQKPPATSADVKVFLLPWLGSAAAVVFARFLHSADLGYDLTLQFQAAENLIRGNGLSIYGPATDNLTDPLSLQTLTHFPSGYSLCAAILMLLGADPGLALKILGGTATLVGWWGWGHLAFAYMRDRWQESASCRWTAFAVAVVTPLLYTLRWSGTDIFAWAAMPWLLLLVVRPDEPQQQDNVRMDALAGVIAGVCILIRYASVFLAGFVTLAIAFQCRRPFLLLRRLGAFAVGLLPFLAWQTYVNVVLSNRPALPGGIELNTDVASGAERAWNGLSHLMTVNAVLLFWSPRGAELVLPGNAYQSVGIALGLAILFIPLAVGAVRSIRWAREVPHDVCVVATLLFVLLPLFLLACEIAGTGYPYARDPRHYSPLIPLAVLVAYSISGSNVRSRLFAPVRYSALTYVAAFLTISVAGTILLTVPGNRGESRREMLMGVSTLHPWPSMSLSYDYSPARNHVLETVRANPGAILLTNTPNWFYADPTVDWSRLQALESCSRRWFSHAAGPTRLLILAADRNGPVQELYALATLATPERVPCYERLPPFRLIRRFPDEELKFMEVEIRQGLLVDLRNAVP
jgi:hypothetical protein